MKYTKLSIALSLGLIAVASTVQAGIKSTAGVDLRLRYETVNQDNAAKDASGLTLRTKLNISSKLSDNLSSFIEFEDNTVVTNVDNYNDTLGNHKAYSVIADPKSTELDQAYLQYHHDKLNLKLGRQVITHDGHRFIGHVGWRQDKQTFDGITLNYAPNKAINLTYSFINQRNRIFAKAKDIDSKDHLLHATYTSKAGKFAAYHYALSQDNGIKNELDTVGGNWSKNYNKLSLQAEIAQQKSTTDTSYRANYFAVSADYQFKEVKATMVLEQLGSDNGLYGFTTPLATLHKFNGWSDQFLGTPKQGLRDIKAAVSGKVLGGKWSAAYHHFSSVEALNGLDDLGTEINLSYAKKLTKHFSTGIKYAAYSAGDSAFGKVDTDKAWLWLGVKF